MNEEYYIDLIYKELEGSISEQEAAQLHDWILDSHEHATLQSDIRAAWKLEELYTTPFPVDTKKGYEATLQKIKSSSEEKRTPKKLKSPNSWLKWSVAASFLLLIGVGLRFYMNNNSQYKTITANDGVMHIILSDQSKVWLRQGSTLKYPIQFSDNERSVELIGRAFFDVAKDPEKTFKITTSNCLVEVLGTSFEVWENSQKSHTDVSVMTGTVSVSNVKKTKSAILEKGQGVIYDHMTDSLSNLIANVGQINSWATKRLSFNSIPLKDAIQSINRYYEVNISSEVNIPSTCILNATFFNEDLDVVLKHLETTLDISIAKNSQREYSITKIGCQ